ncbi:MAG: hypothetical protein JXA21_09855, partial [Anaerolineae bacterium]|nr:hypothetical protein [Anaerolineae bacterium]
MLPKFFRNLNLGVKLNAAIVLVFIFLLVILSVVAIGVIDNLIAQMGQQRATQEASLIQSRFSEAEQALSTNARLLANTPGLIEALANEDITRFRVLLATGAAPLNFDDLELVSTEGVHLIGGGYAASAQEDELITLALLGIEARGSVIAEKETGEQEFRMVVASPLRDVTSEILGVLVASRTVDDAFLKDINFARTEDINLGLIYATQVLAQDYLDPETGEFAQLLEET